MRNKGFTLIEIIIVVAVLTIILSFGMTIDLNTFRGDTFLVEQSKIVSVLERARSHAMANMFNTDYGVCYFAPDYVIFRDGTCDKSSTDESIPANVNISENSTTTFPPTIVFEQLTGNLKPQLIPPNSEINITISDGIKSANITINNEGAINW